MPYSSAERKARKMGSLGSVASLIAAIGGGTSMEPGKNAPVPKKKKKKKKPSLSGGSTEMQQMLAGQYTKGKKRRFSLGQ